MITQEYVTPLFNLFVVPPEFKPRTDLFPRYAFPHYNAGTDQAVKVTEINVTGLLVWRISDESLGMGMHPSGTGVMMQWGPIKGSQNGLPEANIHALYFGILKLSTLEKTSILK